MRIWDINPNVLCRQHLLGEHREIHAIWSIITQNKKGYANHPETKRWKGKLKALYNRHEEIVKEMKKRGFIHNSPLEKKLAIGKDKQNVYIATIEDQMNILNNKNCKCKF
ncbi:MAG: hypothetical protein JSU91_00615 [Thermoplasmatales archaeon]|nr:MAG: hypothetical protein JSU91_00615 [Thermoplasmatales archaeon]